MKTKKTIIIVAAVVVVVLTATGIALANWDNITSLYNGENNDAEQNPSAADSDAGGVPTEIPGYLSITGVIVSIEETESGTRFVIEDENGNPAHLVANSDTEFVYHWLVRRAVGVGDTLTGWYSASMPMILIWPPEYNVSRLDIQDNAG